LRGGDIFSALNACLDEIERTAAKKKGKKRIFLFTNGSGDTVFDEYRVKR